MASFNIRRHAYGLITPLLEDAGFRKNKGVFTVELRNDCLGWIGLPDAVRDNTIAISATIGLRHRSVHLLIGRLMDRADDGISPPTVSISLGFLLAEQKWREWYFNREDTQETIGQFTELLCGTAFGFFEKNADLAAIEALLDSPDYVRAQIDFFERLPVVKYLRGDVAGAINSVERFAALMADHVDPRSKKYRNNFRPALIGLCQTKLGS